MTGFYMKFKTKLKWVNQFLLLFVSSVFSILQELLKNAENHWKENIGAK